MVSGASPGTHSEDRQTRYVFSSLPLTIHAALDSDEWVAAQPGSAWSATRTRRRPPLVNRHFESGTLLPDPRRRSRATLRTGAWSTARSRAEADQLFFALRPVGIAALEAVRHRGKGTIRLAQRRDTYRPECIELP